MKGASNCEQDSRQEQCLADHDTLVMGTVKINNVGPYKSTSLETKLSQSAQSCEVVPSVNGNATDDVTPTKTPKEQAKNRSVVPDSALKTAGSEFLTPASMAMLGINPDWTSPITKAEYQNMVTDQLRDIRAQLKEYHLKMFQEKLKEIEASEQNENIAPANVPHEQMLVANKCGMVQMSGEIFSPTHKTNAVQLLAEEESKIDRKLDKVFDSVRETAYSLDIEPNEAEGRIHTSQLELRAESRPVLGAAPHKRLSQHKPEPRAWKTSPPYLRPLPYLPNWKKTLSKEDYLVRMKRILQRYEEAQSLGKCNDPVDKQERYIRVLRNGILLERNVLPTLPNRLFHV